MEKKDQGYPPIPRPLPPKPAPPAHDYIPVSVTDQSCRRCGRQRHDHAPAVETARERIAPLVEAAEAAIAFLRLVEWNDHTSEENAYDIREQLEAALRAAAEGGTHE